MTLGEVVIQNPAAAEIFEDLDIDYSCRGNRLLSDALKEHNVPLDAFTGELARVGHPKRKQASQSDWRSVPLRVLIKHIVETHHGYLHSELPALEQLIAGILLHESSDGVPLADLHRTVQHLKRELELQMRKEEAILFPAIAELESAIVAGGQPRPSQFGSVANLSRVLGQDHHKAARELHEIRVLTNNYCCAPGVQTSIPALFRRLRYLAADMHRHVHLENNILFPRAIALERGERND
jgi:regulator of cell morphogenesis and NO signaling